MQARYLGGYAAAILTIFLLGARPAAAAPQLNWDPSATGTSTGGGTGTWDTGSWWNGTADIGWTSGDDAIFGGTGGMVTIQNGVTANNLYFNTTGYNVTGSSLTLNGGTVFATANATIGSLVAGNAGLTVTGPGMLTLNGASSNAFTGGISLANGRLSLDFTNMSSPANLVSSANAVTLSAGALSLKGQSAGTSSQTFSGLTVGSGASYLNFNSNGGTLNVALGSVTRTTAQLGGLDVTLPSFNAGFGTVSATVTAVNNYVPVDSGSFRDFMTVNGGKDWAAISNNTTTGNIVPLSSITPSAYTLDALNTFSTHTEITKNDTFSTTSQQTGDLYFNTTGATVTIASGKSLGVNAGGILVIPGVSAAVTGGTLFCNGSGDQLQIFDYGQMTISSVITNNSGTAVPLIVSGTGNTTLGTDNSFTGNMAVNGGTVSTSTAFSGNLTVMGSLNATRTISVNPGATLFWGTNNVLIGGGSKASVLPTVALNGGTLFSNNYNAIGNVTLSGGTLSQNSTANVGNPTGQYQGYDFLGSVTVNGSASSLISAGSNNDHDHLFPTTSGSTTFNVAVTGASGADLVVTAGLTNTSNDYGLSSASSSASGLIKTGAGTMLLSGSNNYSGTTYITGGTLAFNGIGNTLAGNVTAGTAAGNPGTLLFQNGAAASFSGTADGAFTINYGSTLGIQPGASVSMASNLKLGSQATGSTGNVVQTGGTLNITGGGGSRALVLGEFPESAGQASTYMLSAGVLNVPNGVTYVPWDGAGVLNVGGGSASLNQIQFGSTDANANTGGTLSLSGGVLVMGSGGITSNPKGPIVINLSGGTLAASAGWSSSQAMTLANTTTINPRNSAITLSGALSGAGGLSTAAGMLTLSGSNNYGGSTTISGGTLSVGSDANLGAAPLSATPNSLVIGNSATLQLTSGFTLNANRGIGLGDAGATISVATATANFGGVLAAGPGASFGSLTKSGTGTFVLSGTGTYTGATNVNAGVLSIASSLSSSTVSVANGATLTAAAGQIAGAVTIAGGGSIDFSKNGLNGTPTTLVVTGLTLGDNSANLASLTFNMNNGTDLLNLGSGTLTVNPSSAEVSLVNLAVTPGTYGLISFGSASGTSNIFLNPADARLGLSALSLSTASNALNLVVTGNPTPNLAYWYGNYAANGGNATWGGFSTGGSSARTNWSLDSGGGTDAGQIVASATDVVFAATSVQGNISTILDAPYTINSLTVTSTGAVAINGGNQTLTINAAASGTGSLGYAAGTGIVMQPGAGALTIGASTVVPTSQSWTNNSNSLLSAASVTGTAAFGNTATLSIAGSGTGGAAISGAISNGAAGGNLALAVNTPNATASLSGSNTYSGGTTISAGTLMALSNSPLGSGAVSMTPASGAALYFTASAPTIGSLSSGGPGMSNIVLGNTANSSSTALTINNGTATTFAGTIADQSAINPSAAGSIVVSSGMLTLAGSNTYTGGTTISNAAIVAGGPTAMGSGPVTLSGGTLQASYIGSGGIGSPAINNAIQINGTSNSFNTSGGNNLVLSGNMSGAGAVSANGGGSVYLAGSNSGFSGTLTVAASTSVFLNGGNAGSQAAGWVNNGILANIGSGPQNIRLGSLSGSGTVANNAAGLVTFSVGALGASTVFSGALLDSLGGGGQTSLILTSGQLTFTGANNSFSGGVTVNTATLQIGNNSNEFATAFGSGTVAINAATLNFYPGSTSNSYSFANSFVFNGATVTGGDGVQHLGTGGATITVTSSGATVQSIWDTKDVYLDGQLTGSGSLAIQNGPGSSHSNAAIVHITNNANTYTGTVTLNAAVNKGEQISIDAINALATATLNLNGSSPNPGTNAGTSDLVFTTLAPNLGALAGNGNFTIPSGVNLTVGAIGSSTTYSGVASGTGSLTMNGTGSMELAGANTYRGGTTLVAGTLIVNSEGASNAGGSLGLTPTAATAGNLTLNGGTLESVAAVSLNANRGVSLSGSATLYATSGRLQIGGTISGGGSLTIAGVGVSTTDVNLAGANTYSGGTTILPGAFIPVSISSVGPAGNPTSGPFGTGTLTLAGGSMRGNNGTATTVGNSVVLAANTTFYSTGGTTDHSVTFAGPVLLEGSYTLTNNQNAASPNAPAIDFNNTISDASNGYSLTFAGTGVTVLAGNNSYSGGTQITGGTVQLGNTFALGTGALAVNSGALDLHGISVTVPSFSGAAGTVTNGGAMPATLTVSQTGTTTFSGTLQDGASQTAIAMTGTGLLKLSGNNAYSGGTQIQSGTLQISSSAALGVGALAANGGTLDLAGYNATVASFSGAAGVVTNNGATPVVLTVNQSTAANFNGTLVDGATSLGLTLTGTGSLQLASSNRYSGGTQLQNGLLQLGSAGALGTGALAVNGGTLDLLGNGILVPSFRGAAGTITNNGAGPATLTVNQSIATTFGGLINDGANQTALSLSGSGALTLSNTNSYSGATTVSNGVLRAGAINAFSPNSAISITGGTLDASGFAQSIYSVSVGSLGSLTLAVGNLISSAGSDTFGGTLNLSGDTGAAILMTYAGETGQFASHTPLPSGYVLSYGATDLAVVAVASGPAVWQVTTGGSWNTAANWNTASAPSGIGVTAVIGTGTASSLSITLDSPQTLSTLVFSNTAGNSSAGYSLNTGTSGSLILDNSGSAAQIVVNAGNHAIAAPVYLVGGDLTVSASNNGVLTISGSISQDATRNITLNGDGSGELIVSGTNNLGGAGATVAVASGTLLLTNVEAVADGTSLTVGDASFFGGIQAAGSREQGAGSMQLPALSPVPEPDALAILAVGAAMLLLQHRIRRAVRT